MDLQILGERILRQSNGIKIVQRYIKGWHPHLGQLHWGLQGPETIVETTVVSLQHLFTVLPTTMSGVA